MAKSQALQESAVGLNNQISELGFDSRYLDENDIITLERMRQEIDMKKREKYYNKRVYEPYRGKDGAWYTYLPDGIKGRKRIKRKTQEEIIDAVAAFYMENEDCPTVIKLFKKWNRERLDNNEIAKNSYARYENDFKRFFKEDDRICKIPIKQIREVDLVEFIKMNINRYHLTRKTYSGLRLLIIGLFKYAKMYGYTEISISTFFHDLSLSRNMFQKNNKKDADNVFNDTEIKALKQYFENHPTIHNLGLLLMFETGMRIGELCVLKPEHITKDGILVNSTEIYCKDPDLRKQVFEIKDSPKQGAEDRIICIPEKTRTILKKIRALNPFGEFLFMKDGKRIHGIRFNYWLYKACDEVGIPHRSTHKIRKTYASKLIDGKVEDSIIMKQMGHANIETTRDYYYYATQDHEYKEKQIERVLGF